MDKGSAQSTVPSMRLPMLLNFNLFLPNEQECFKIVDFLDEKCNEIDSLAKDIEEQIETLEEYKKSVITEAVTKGLDPNVEMKDSGIEWIGDVPKDWELCKIKQCCEVCRGGSPRPINDYLTDDEGYNWIMIGDTVKGCKFIDSTKHKIILAGAKSSRFVKKGTLIVSNSMSFGEAYILNIDGCVHDGWLVVIPSKLIDKIFGLTSNLVTLFIVILD